MAILALTDDRQISPADLAAGILVSSLDDPITVTVPPLAVDQAPVGAQLEVIQVGDGTVTVEADTGAAIRHAPDTALVLSGQGATVRLLKVAHPASGDQVWVATGDLAPIPAAWPLSYTTWAPGLTTSGAAIAGHGTGATRRGRYTQIGKKVSGWGYVELGADPSIAAGLIGMTLPVPAATQTALFGSAKATPFGTGYIVDGETFEDRITAVVSNETIGGDGQTVVFILDEGDFDAGTGLVSDSAPFAMVAGSVVLTQFEYEAA